ncbi:MAG: hypothetical protein KIT84_32655 [Labilithrix sp.]|nr:hypothetical protein [Labilithrix sp.]MCW5815826.1 hypothetical protein [Labilithrix sp.]
MKAGPLTLDELGPILSDVIDEVAATHARGEIDRGLRPSRVVLEGGRARLVPEPNRKLAALDDLDSFNVTIGSFTFMAPELVRGSANVDGRADIYAIGAIAFSALAGKTPFDGHNALTRIALKLDRPAPTLEEIAGRAFPPLVESFVATALARDRDARYPSIGVMREAWRLVCSAE